MPSSLYGQSQATTDEATATSSLVDNPQSILPAALSADYADIFKSFHQLLNTAQTHTYTFCRFCGC